MRSPDEGTSFCIDFRHRCLSSTRTLMVTSAQVITGEVLSFLVFRMFAHMWFPVFISFSLFLWYRYSSSSRGFLWLKIFQHLGFSPEWVFLGKEKLDLCWSLFLTGHMYKVSSLPQELSYVYRRLAIQLNSCPHSSHALSFLVWESIHVDERMNDDPKPSQCLHTCKCFSQSVCSCVV